MVIGENKAQGIFYTWNNPYGTSTCENKQMLEGKQFFMGLLKTDEYFHPYDENFRRA